MMDKYQLNLQLNKFVFDAIGLELDRQGNVVDQDTGIQLQLNGKFIKYYFGNNPQIIDSNDKIFDASKDSYLMNFLVSYYIEKIKLEGSSLYIHSYHPILDKRTNTSCLELKGFVGQNIFQASTKFYKNDSIKFIEALYILSGETINLTEYDNLLSYYEEEEIKEAARLLRKSRRRKKNDSVQPGTIKCD